MITLEKLTSLKAFFKNYTKQFTSEDKSALEHFQIKIRHTWRVCKNSVDIGKSIHLSDDDLHIAETIALLHDIGRFMQYRKYKTFMDHKSDNHAKIGLEVIQEEKILDDVPKNTKELIQQVIFNHNQPFIPDNCNDRVLLFSKLIRDADKLDIYKVVLIYENINKNLPEENNEHFHLKDEYVESFRDQKIIRLEDVSGRLGFFLLRISWIFDLNFDYSLLKVKKEGYIQTFLDKIPPSENLNEVKKLVNNYFSAKKLTLTSN